MVVLGMQWGGKCVTCRIVNCGKKLVRNEVGMVRIETRVVIDDTYGGINQNGKANPNGRDFCQVHYQLKELEYFSTFSAPLLRFPFSSNISTPFARLRTKFDL